MYLLLYGINYATNLKLPAVSQGKALDINFKKGPKVPEPHILKNLILIFSFKDGGIGGSHLKEFNKDVPHHFHKAIGSWRLEPHIIRDIYRGYYSLKAKGPKVPECHV